MKTTVLASLLTMALAVTATPTGTKETKKTKDVTVKQAQQSCGSQTPACCDAKGSCSPVQTVACKGLVTGGLLNGLADCLLNQVLDLPVNQVCSGNTAQCCNNNSVSVTSASDGMRAVFAGFMD